MPGPLDLLVQLAGLGVFVGLTLAVAVGKHADAISAALGAQRKSLPSWLALRFGALGACVALAYAAASARGGAHVHGLPGFWPLLVGAGLGFIVLLAVIRRWPSLPEALAGVAGGAIATLALAAAIAYWHWAVARTVLVGTAAGVLLGSLWLVARMPVMAFARTIGRPLRLARPGVVTVILTGAMFGAAAAGAWLVADGPRAPAWAAVSVVVTSLVLSPVLIRLAAPPARLERLELGGYRTTILRVRRRNKRPPVVVFHGYADDAERWRPVIELLAAQCRRRLVVISIPGIVPGVGPLENGPLLPQLKRFGREALEQLFPGESVFGFGHSLGGRIVLDLACEDGASASPLCGFQVLGTMGLDRSRPLRIAGGRPVGALIRVALRYVPAPLVERIGARIYRTVNPTAEPWAVERVRRLVRDRSEGHPVLQIGSKVLSELRGLVDLASIRIPGHLLFGAGDWLSSPDSSAALVRLVRRDNLAADVIKGWGHSPNFNDPRGLVDRLLGSPAYRRASRRGRRARTA